MNGNQPSRQTEWETKWNNALQWSPPPTSIRPLIWAIGGTSVFQWTILLLRNWMQINANYNANMGLVWDIGTALFYACKCVCVCVVFKSQTFCSHSHNPTHKQTMSDALAISMFAFLALNWAKQTESLIHSLIHSLTWYRKISEESIVMANGGKMSSIEWSEASANPIYHRSAWTQHTHTHTHTMCNEWSWRQRCCSCMVRRHWLATTTAKTALWPHSHRLVFYRWMNEWIGESVSQ